MKTWLKGGLIGAGIAFLIERITTILFTGNICGVISIEGYKIAYGLQNCITTYLIMLLLSLIFVGVPLAVIIVIIQKLKKS